MTRTFARLLLVLSCSFFLCIDIASSQPSSSSPDTLSFNLESAVRRALEISPEVGVVESDRAFAAARSQEARSSRFLTEFQATTAHSVAPGLDIPSSNQFPADALYLNPEVRNDWEDLRPFNRIEVEATQPIYTWGELGGSIRAARHSVEVESARVQDKELEVAFRTTELYYNLLLTEELARIAEETRDVIDRAQREINRLLEEGAEDVDYADLYQVQITEQEFERRFVEVQQQRQTARTALRRQLLLPDGTFVRAEDPFLEPLDFSLDSLDTYLDLALAHRPELAQAHAGLAARRALVEVARSDFFPKLFLAGSATWSYAEGRFKQDNPYISEGFRENSVRAGFGLRQKLNFFQTRARVEQAEAERNQVEHQLEAARQLVLFETEQRYRDLIIAEAALNAQDEALTISDRWLRDEQINFDLDLGDTENLVKAVRANLELQARYYEAVQRYNLAILRLMRATGVLQQRIQSGTLVDG